MLSLPCTPLIRGRYWAPTISGTVSLKNPNIKALSSHHLRYPMGQTPGTIFFDCCFLRHPLTRLQSLYEHYRRTGDEDWLSRLARHETSQGFLKTLVESAPHVVSNVQTLYLSTAGAFTRPAGSWDLERAIEILHKWHSPVLVEQFDESLVSAEYFLRPAFPELRLEYVAQNVSPAKDDGRSGAGGSRLIALWGDELHSQLVRLNEYDLKLHSEPRTRLHDVDQWSRAFPDFWKSFNTVVNYCDLNYGANWSWVPTRPAPPRIRRIPACSAQSKFPHVHWNKGFLTIPL